MVRKIVILLLTAIAINITFNNKKAISAPLNPDNKKSFLQIDSPDVWLTSELKGIEKYNIRKRTFEKYDINENNVIKIIKAGIDYFIINKFKITKINGKTKELSVITVDVFPKDKEIECITDNGKGFYAGLKGIIGYYDYVEKKWQKWELPDDYKSLKIINIFPSANLLIIITEKNILKLNLDEKEYRIMSDENEKIKKAVISKNRNSVYIIYDKNIKSFDVKTSKKEAMNGLDNENINQIWQDEFGSNNNLWMAGETFLIKYDLINKKVFDYTEDCLISDLAAKGNNLTIGNIIKINDLKTDKKIVWIATDGGGVIEIDTNGVKHKTRRWTENDGLPSNYIDCLEIDDNRIYACFNDGLAKLEKGKGKWDVLRNPSEIEIFSNGELKISKLTSGEGYYGFIDSGTLYLYMRKEGKWIEIGKKIMDVAEDGNILWLISDDNEIFKYELENGKKEIIYPADKFRSKIVCRIISDKDCIYAGVSDGVFSYNKRDKIWQKIFNADSKIITYLADDNIFIWIGTRNNGVICYDKKSKKIMNYGKAQGMLEDSVFLIGIDQEYIWIIHNGDSLSRLSKMTNYWDTYEKVKNQNSKFKIKRFIPNEVLNSHEKRWQIGKDWKVLKKVPGGLGGKWIEGEIDTNFNFTQIVMDDKLQLTWFISNGELIKYNQLEDTFEKAMPAEFIRNSVDRMLVSTDNGLKIVLKK